MARCSSRTWSYISASFQLTCCIIAFLLIIVGSIMAYTEESNGGVVLATAAIVVTGVFTAVGIGMLVTLIVGIKQNRLELVSVYVYMNYVILALFIIFLIYELTMNLINAENVDIICINIFINLGCIALELILFSPIIILHAKMRAQPILPTTHKPKTPATKSPSGF